jgi:membrane protein DedA with SNARE-associated domain
VAITAGTSHLPYRRFLLFEGMAALAWNLVWIVAGYAVGEHLAFLERVMGGAGLALVLVAVVGYLGYRPLVRGRSVHHEVT